jgi:hypothetical protein
MPTSNKPLGLTLPTASGIEAEVNRLSQTVGELRRVQATSRRITTILALILVAEFAVFTYFTLQHVQANFSQDDLQKAVAERVPQVTPELQQRIVAVARKTMPVYRELATERFQKVGPEIARDALARLQRLPQENGEELNSHLQKAFDTALSRIEPDMKKAFPSLSEEQQVSILHAEFLGAVDKENEEIAHHINGLAENELKSMNEVLNRFDIPSEASMMSPQAREREFLHALVDVMMDGEFTLKKPADSGSPSTRPSMVSAGAPSTPIADSTPVTPVSH